MSHPQLSPNVKGNTTMSDHNSILKENTTMLPLNPIIAKLTKLQSHTALMAQLTQEAQGDVISINRRDLQLAFADIQQTISGICAQLSNETETTSSYSVSGSSEHSMIEHFWDAYDYLNEQAELSIGDLVNHHSTDADTIAININQVYSLAYKNNQPLPYDIVELKRHLRNSYRYKFVDSNIAVKSDIYNGKTVKCWIFQKPLKAIAPSETYVDQYDQPMTVTEVKMTEPFIVRQRAINKNQETIQRQFYVPSISEEQRNKGTLLGLCTRYGVELPVYYHDIDVSRFCEKTYYDENGDKQRVLVPLFKERGEGEHTQAFYQRVGLLLPPMD